MCVSPIEIHRKVAGKVQTFVVPCGKCPECLNAKQNDNAVLSYLEAVKRGKLVFATLTYNNETFPIKARNVVVDKDGIEQCSSPSFVTDSISSDFRKEYIDLVGEDFSKPVRLFVLEDKAGKKSYFEYAPSLCRKDFQDLLKRARVRYERAHGKDSLPDFSYMLVGEYGEQHHRPHYHVCFYGLDISVVSELLHEWPRLYGFHDIRKVERFTSDPSHDGFFAASRYLGKYLTKGESDSYNVLCGLAEKSRVCRSIGFGLPDKRVLQSLLSITLWKIMMDIHWVSF